MKKLSKESAEWHYEKLLELHKFRYLTFSQKISVFQQDLEHDILEKITGKQKFFDQLNCLRDNQILLDRNGKNIQGDIPQAYVSDIENLKKWRNRGVHEDDMTEVKYLNHFQTMVQTIKHFSEIKWSKEIDNIINNKLQTYPQDDNKNDKKDHRIRFSLINNEQEIKNNIKKYLCILKNEPNNAVIKIFSTFKYWYYIKDLNVFIPNLFLGYRDCAVTPYEKGFGTQGSDANNKLKKYFKNAGSKKLYSKLEKFVKEYDGKLNAKVTDDTIFEPNEDYYNMFNKI